MTSMSLSVWPSAPAKALLAATGRNDDSCCWCIHGVLTFPWVAGEVPLALGVQWQTERSACSNRALEELFVTRRTEALRHPTDTARRTNGCFSIICTPIPWRVLALRIRAGRYGHKTMHTTDASPQDPSGLTRRKFLRLAGAGVLAAVASARLLTLTDLASFALKGWRWSNPATWGGRVPRRGDVAVVSKKVILDVDASVAGVEIKPGGQLIFHPGRSITLRSNGNVVVRGRLVMRPRTARKVHELAFMEVDERRFNGGGMEVLSSDVGLWVMDRGVLDIVGARKLPWTRPISGVPGGTTTLELAEDPFGWRVGDHLAVTPTLPPTVPRHHEAYDHARVKAISGRTVTLSEPTKYEHPAVRAQRGIVFTPEVLNLTRNVRIQGTPSGRAHVFIRSSRPQSIRHATIRHMGPVNKLGRYGLHFHMMHDASRGSVVEGVVINQCESHAFVSHLSHGITYKDCVSHDTLDDAYWWDPPSERGEMDSFADDTTYERCVASLVRDPGGFRHTAFALAARHGNVARNCVAVGVEGKKNASGYFWPENGQGVWVFEDCLAHNNANHGIFVWQNTNAVHPIERFHAYHNGGFAVEHGAYNNPYIYHDIISFGNKGGGFMIHAQTRADAPKVGEYRRIDVDGLRFTTHRGPPNRTRFWDSTLRRVVVAEDVSAKPGWFEFIRTDLEPAIWTVVSMHPESIYRVQREDGTAYQLQPDGSTTVIRRFA
jgi:hypothetical protein